MAIRGFMVFENFTIQYNTDPEYNSVHYTVSELMYANGRERTENLSASLPDFFKALAILVHHDGMPDYTKDYPAAESIMGKIRWIP